MQKPRLLRIATIPASIQFLLHGQLDFMKEQGFEVFAASAAGEDVKEIVKGGVRHDVIPFTRTISPWRDLLCLIGLIRLIRKLKPDIVHTHTPKAGLLGMAAAWLCGVKVRMHTVAGLPVMEATGIKKRILLATEKITYAAATQVYPNSKGLSQYIHQFLHPATGKFKVMGHGSSNGVDTDYFSRTNDLMAAAKKVRTMNQIHPDEVCFCFVGRLVCDKGVVELVHAFQKIRSNEKVKLLLVGSFESDLDPLPREVLDFVHACDDVILTGFQKDVRPFMLASDAFVFPSYREGFPNVILQACCLEIPCIATNINGCNEIIQDNVTGKLISPKNEMELEAAMQNFMENRTPWNRYAIRAKEQVIANFDRQTYWKFLVDEYRALYNRHVLKSH